MKLLIILAVLISCANSTKETKVTKLKNVVTGFDKLWNYSDPVMTREKFNEYLQGIEKSSQDEDYWLQLQTQIARTYSLKLEFDNAHKILNEVEKRLSEKTPVARVRYFLERGRTYNSAQEKTKAKQLFIDAFEFSSKIGTDTYTVDAAHMVAIAADSLDEKVKWSEIGVSAASESSDEAVKRWVGVFFNNSGWDLFEAKRYTEALEKFIKCEQFHKEHGNLKNQDIALWSIAKTYRYLGRIEEALEIQESLLIKVDMIDESGYTYEELAELYLINGEVQKAKEFFAKAYDVLSKDTWLQKYETKRLERLLSLSK